jgi:hypothetical protein
MNPSKPGALTNLRAQEEGQVRTRNEAERGALTSWRAPTEGQVRTQNESERARGTHVLEGRDGGTNQDKGKIQTSARHLLSGERRPSDKSGHGKIPSERGALTVCRAETEGQVRSRNEC